MLDFLSAASVSGWLASIAASCRGVIGGRAFHDGHFSRRTNLTLYHILSHCMKYSIDEVLLPGDTDSIFQDWWYKGQPVHQQDSDSDVAVTAETETATPTTATKAKAAAKKTKATAKAAKAKATAATAKTKAKAAETTKAKPAKTEAEPTWLQEHLQAWNGFTMIQVQDAVAAIRHNPFFRTRLTPRQRDVLLMALLKQGTAVAATARATMVVDLKHGLSRLASCTNATPCLLPSSIMWLCTRALAGRH